MTYQNYSLKQLQAIDAAHHLHPFTDHKELRGAGSRMIVRADGPFIYDSARATRSSTAWPACGASTSATAATSWPRPPTTQMKELPYYNSFFKCSTPTPVLLAKKLAEIAPKNINQVFFGSSGSEANDTALRLVRHYWALEGKPEKNRIISRNDGLSRLDGRRRVARRHGAHARPARRRGAQHRPCHDALCLRAGAAGRERPRFRPARRQGRRGRDPRSRRRTMSRPSSASRSWGQAASRSRRRATGRRSSASAANTTCC